MNDDSQSERHIETAIGSRLGKPCVWTPSGRLALFLALRTSLKPDDRILMSPVNDDVVFFTVLAAGLRPVMAPVTPADGNIDVSAVHEATWRRISAVLTTNLYGVPDDMVKLQQRAAQHGFVLIEDVAHAIASESDRRPVGGFGVSAVFSLSKHVQAHGGGVLAVNSAEAAAHVARMRDVLVKPPSARLELARIEGKLRPQLRRAAVRTHFIRPAVRVRRLVQPDEREGYRMPLRAPQLSELVERAARTTAAQDGAQEAAALDSFESWLRVDLHSYRHYPSTMALRAAVKGLQALEAHNRIRLAAVERLRVHPLAARGVKQRPAAPLFRVPLLVRDRDEVRRAIESHGVPSIGYIFDPPLDDYAGPAFADASPSPEAARWWARHVLPVDPMHADATLEALDHLQVEPAPGPGRVS